MSACPGCGASDIGGPIPEEIVEYYVPWEVSKAGKESVKEWLKTNPWPTWQRFTGIEVRGLYDGVLIWKCPDCDHMWPRFGENSWPAMYNKAIDTIKKWKEKGQS